MAGGCVEGVEMGTSLSNPRSANSNSARTAAVAGAAPAFEDTLHHLVYSPRQPHLHSRAPTASITPLAGSAAILCIGGLDVIRKEAWPVYRTSSGVRLCWELEEPKGPKGLTALASMLVRLGIRNFEDVRCFVPGSIESNHNVQFRGPKKSRVLEFWFSKIG